MREEAEIDTPGGVRAVEAIAVAQPAAEDGGRRYRRLVEGVAEHLRRCVPAGARVLMVSRGDNRLLAAEGRDVQHFPQTRTGLYAGYHPADGEEAVTHLEELRLKGAEYLAVPATAGWWLDHYAEFRDYLESRGERVIDDPDICAVYALEPTAEAPWALGADDLQAARTAPQVSELLGRLLPESEGVLLVGSTAAAVEVGGRPCWTFEPPEGQVTPSAHDLLERAEAARSGGARYVALLKSDRPSDHLDERVRRRIAERLRPVCLQRLVEIYKLAEPTA